MSDIDDRLDELDHGLEEAEQELLRLEIQLGLGHLGPSSDTGAKASGSKRQRSEFKIDCGARGLPTSIRPLERIQTPVKKRIDLQESTTARRYLEATQDLDWLKPDKLLPGRLCRPEVTPEKIGLTPKSFGKDFELRPAHDVCSKERKPSTFGSEARFREATSLEDVQGQLLLKPKEDFLSNRTASKSALISQPTALKPGQLRDAKRWLTKMAKDTGSEEVLAVALASGPGLRGISSAWQALLREEQYWEEKHLEEDDDASTEANTEMAELSFWSSTSDISTPGPGSYEPKFSSVQANLGRGVPSFARYSARDPKPKQLEEEDAIAGSDASNASRILLPEGSSTVAADAKKVRGGKINPPPTATPRAPTEASREALAASTRPFYDAKHYLVEPAVQVANFSQPETGRLGAPETTDMPGPGSYNLHLLVPGGRSAFIAPEPTPPTPEIAEIRLRASSAPPGPGAYDVSIADALVYPSVAEVDFDRAAGHFVYRNASHLAAEPFMAFQQAPLYTSTYGPLDPRWQLQKPRSREAVILPEISEEAEVLQTRRKRHQAGLGPGTYEVDDHLTMRIRPDTSVLNWIPNRNGIPEHTKALFADVCWKRGDPRALLDPDADLLLRRRHREALMLPEHRSLRRSWSAGDRWRLYDPQPPPEPEGPATFSRALEFEEWPLYEAKMKALAARNLKRRMPNIGLSYSLPSLEVTKSRVPAAEFTKLQGRGDHEVASGLDSPREGDVLLLSLNAEKHLFHPRSPCMVDMAKLTGRKEDNAELVDDFEELVLTPRPITRRVPSVVNMAKTTGRPDHLELNAHVWADVPGHGVFVTKPLAASERPEEPLLGEAVPGDNLLVRRSARCSDFGRPLGRAGHDPRVVDINSASTQWASFAEEDALLPNFQPRFTPQSNITRP